MSTSGEISVEATVDAGSSDAKGSDTVLSRDPFGTVQLDAYARHLATALLVSSRPVNLAKKFQQRFNEHVKTIQAAYAACVSFSDQEHPSLSVNDWLVDNYYVVLEQIRDIRDHLPPSFYRELPKLEDGRPRIHALAYELTAHSDSALDEDLLVRFVDQFQTNAELTIGELWAFPVMLRLVLIENLAQIAEQIQEELKSTSDAVVLHRIWKSEHRIQLFHPSSLRSAATLIALHDKLRDSVSPNDGGLIAFKRSLHSLGWDLAELRRLEQHRLASNQVTIGNIITSMRLLSGLDWVVFFEQTNRTERILRRDPAKVYARMDLASRNRCRTAVEQLAKRSGKTESEVAQIVLKTADESSTLAASVTVTASASKTSAEAQASVEFAAVRKHVGYWLIDDGRNEIEAAIHYRPTAGEQFKRLVGSRPNLVYFGGLFVLNASLIAAFAVVCFAIGVTWWPLAVFTLLAIVPISDVAVLILNTVITRIATVQLLPKLNYSEGIDPQFPTFIVVPSMLTSHREANALIARLENHYLANTDPNCFYSLLTDFADADTRHASGDDEILQTAIAGIQSLNKKYQRQGKQPFYLFHRERRWNAAQEKWMGWERKRGKLMEFGRLLHGSNETSYDVIEGDVESLGAFRSSANRPFVITLDADTVLPRGAAQKLVGTLAHPLNRPIVSQGSRPKVIRGYSILQPRVSIHLNESHTTRYLQVHAVNPGIDPYASAASDVYQDLFRDGSFTGKGIYDLRAFDSTLEQTFPENQILSHDLIEGCHARVALVSDIEVFDGYPSRYDVDAKRMHRWVRGDWQISPWLLSRVPSACGVRKNCLSALSRWKILDNQRRSLVPIMILLLLSCGWLFQPAAAGLWSGFAATIMFAPAILQLLSGWLNWNLRKDFKPQFGVYLKSVLKLSEQCLYSAIFLPHKSLQMFDAILRTCYRMLISRCRLLEWETAAASESRLTTGFWSIARRLSITSLVAITVGLLIAPESRMAAAPWLLAWLVAPVVGQVISTPHSNRERKKLVSDSAWIREISSATWAFFEHHVNGAGNWLPPDNMQEYPNQKVATRISPTNEGLFLVSGMVARRFGFTGLDVLISLLEKNRRGWNSLEQLKGHHFNWYETTEPRALHPKYISTVDSGNLLACYLTVTQAIADIGSRPVVSQEQAIGARTSFTWLRGRIAFEQNRNKGTSDDQHRDTTTLSLLDQSLREIQTTMPSDVVTFADIQTLVERLNAASTRLSEWSQQIERPVHPSASFGSDGLATLSIQTELVTKRFQGICQDVRSLMPWLVSAVDLEAKLKEDGTADRSLLDLISPATSLRELSQFDNLLSVHETLRQTLAPEFLEQLQQSSNTAQSLWKRFSDLAAECERSASSIDFKFLYNQRRKLFSIGYNVDTGKLDRSHYDMLCSECRIASYLAIAKGDVETEHWFRLGRQATELNGSYALLSWGGTMFEYLMPQIFQRTYEDSLLQVSCMTAIDQQVRYGQQRGVPWGISESATSVMAKNMDYQYKSFGVPGLGLKRGLSKDLVVSPYSTALTLPFAPMRAVANLKRLAETALGPWGFYDAIDFTPSRLGRKKSQVVVRNYMAHHQAMSLLSFANAIYDDVVVNWFHAHPLARANDLLLQEKTPAIVDGNVQHPDEVASVERLHEDAPLVSRRVTGVQVSSPSAMLMSNGSFTAMLTHTGGSFASFGETQITRWRSDSTRDHWGLFLYLRDNETQDFWSATYQPTLVEPDQYEALLSVDKGEIRRLQGTIETLMEVVVCPQHNVEVRQLRITNHGKASRRIEVTSYAEVSLATQGADIAHPAFQKLFVETEFVQEDNTLLARRRPRDNRQPPVFAVHTMAVPAAFQDSLDYETDREKFLGRGRNAEAPIALSSDALTQTVGAVLDPVFSLRCVLTIPAAESVTIGITTGFAASRDEALSVADLFHDLRGVQRTFELAWAFAQVEMRHLNLTAVQIHLFQRLGGFLLFPNESMRGAAEKITANRLGQRALWRFGISGDRPILLIRIADTHQIEVFREVSSAHFFLLSRGFVSDLVVCNDFPGSYFDTLQEQLQSIIDERRVAEKPVERVFLLRGSQLTVEDHTLLETVATVVLRAADGSLAQQLEKANDKNLLTVTDGSPHRAARRFKKTLPSLSDKRNGSVADSNAVLASAHSPTEFANKFGHFADDGQKYKMRLLPNRPTPLPWSNVIANPQFGCLITESGGGNTWFGNSRENKLTEWSNDPVTDSPSEILYFRDTESDEIWTPLSFPSDTMNRTATHGQGYSRFTVTNDEIESEILVAIHKTQPLKFIRIRLHNRGKQARQLEATYFAETVLGVTRDSTLLHQVSEFDESASSILMRNRYHPQFADLRLFLTVRGAELVSWTADRRSFLGRDGSHHDPAGLHQPLNRRFGAGLDPCLAIQGQIRIEPQQTEELLFLLGTASDTDDLADVLREMGDVSTATTEIAESIEAWNEMLSALTIQTPNRAMDVMANRWLVYQVLSCRYWGRSTFYQPGGAYGFRDQLQDVLALLYSRPDLAREQILRASSRQYVEGDVQHWWHPPLGKGTRTRFSDDFLFLPYAVLQYLEVTGDRSILDESTSFLQSSPLRSDEHERYEEPAVSLESATLLEHCRRTFKHAMQYGRHGLPLMGCGDWNDGMSRVGESGEGESVWLAWFQIVIFERFAKLLYELDESGSEELETQAARLRSAAEEHAWDGQWYRRAFFDDGTPLGSQQNDECQIDSLPQSWAVIAGAPRDRAREAFYAAIDRLADYPSAMIRLFAPAFDKTKLEPGYIKGYLPGVRENGGQYTHAALWMVQAAVELGDGNLAMRLFELLNPIRHSDSEEQADRYKVEPYVVAADVYFNEQHKGRGGWTWYTGSAAWMYRVAIENILGIQITKDKLSVHPVVPDDWQEFRFTYRRSKTTWNVHVKRRSETDDAVSFNEVVLHEDGQMHNVELGFE